MSAPHPFRSFRASAADPDATAGDATGAPAAAGRTRASFLALRLPRVTGWPAPAASGDARPLPCSHHS
ncbi:hypothetical protein [Streptomyces sp. NPDC001568]|uniref:hypothetical protein n=1 Tax=Streptomyces sp. NPDC001568 TaxID=3364588 RepID=UPI00367AE819